MEDKFTDWAHRPPHLYRSDASYFITSRTYGEYPYFDSAMKKDMLLKTIEAQCATLEWELEAWAILDNHYHMVAIAPDSGDVGKLMRRIHSISARETNYIDGTPRRKVWFQYWDTCINTEKRYIEYLKYVHENPQKHGLVMDAGEYPWCSMGWLMGREPELVRLVLGADTRGLAGSGIE